MAGAPPFEFTTRLVARALSMPADALLAAFRPATLADLDEVVAFRQRHLGQRVRWNDHAYLPWRYRLGRPGEGFGELWLLRRDEQLLGLVGAEQIVLRRGDEQAAAQRLMDLLIRPDVADCGLGAWLNQAMFRQAPLTLAIGANEHSSGLVQRLFTPLPPMRSALCPIHLAPLLRRLAAAPRWARPLAPAADLALAASRRLQRSLASGFTIQALEQFDERWVLPTALPARSGAVTVQRSASQLNRRVFANPRVRIQVSGALRNRQPAGYMAWRLRQRPDGERELSVLDWRLHGQAGGEAWHALLCDVIAHAQRAGCSSVRLLAQHTRRLPRLRRLGFFIPAGNVPLAVGLHAPAPEDARGWAEADWLLTELTDDGDEA